MAPGSRFETETKGFPSRSEERPPRARIERDRLQDILRVPRRIHPLMRFGWTQRRHRYPGRKSVNRAPDERMELL